MVHKTFANKLYNVFIPFRLDGYCLGEFIIYFFFIFLSLWQLLVFIMTTEAYMLNTRRHCEIVKFTG